MTLRPSLISLTVAGAMALPAMAAEEVVEQITVFGSQQAVDQTPGAGVYLDKERLQDYVVTDVMRVLSSAPGVYVNEEEGFGLRPNIGMRGNSSDRSEKITVMEDGVLAAPAPYASPAAYYFPTVGRMSAIEILKGSSSVKYGPRTSGGILNLVSTPIPEAPLAGKVDLSVGEYGFNRLHANIGGANEDVAGLIEIFHYGADGFRTLSSGQDTGFSKQDVMAKLAGDLDAAGKHNLELKLAYAQEDSDESYLGLTKEDVLATPFKRYAASQLDNMDTEHKHISLHYDWFIGSEMDVSIIAYQNDFHRNWYKTQKIDGNSLGKGAEEAASAFETNPSDSLDVRLRANNRGYLATGIQAELGWRLDRHEFSIGARIHQDEMDRFQWEDDYVLLRDLSMGLVNGRAAGTQSNYIDSANAFSIFFQDEVQYDALTITAGLRYEDVRLTRENWGKSDPERNAVAARRDNSVSALLPSLGMTYQVNPEVLLLAGVQKAFAPPSPGNQNAEEEKGWNYEAGARFNSNGIKGEVIAFYSKLDNLHGNCTLSQGCADDTLAAQYNAGEVSIRGMEFVAAKEWQLGQLWVPVNLNMTYSDAEFNQSFESKLDSWGDVQAGDELPYLPTFLWQLETGVRGDNWQVLVAVRHMDEVRTEAGRSAINMENGIESYTLVDLSASYAIDAHQQVFMSVDNLLDKDYISTQRLGGYMAGKPRAVQVGYRYSF